MDDTTMIRTGTVLLNAVEPTLALLHRLGADMDWQPPERPPFPGVTEGRA